MWVELHHSIHARGERVEDVLKETQEKPKVSGQVSTANMEDSVSVSEHRNDNHNGSCNVSNDLEDGELEEKCEAAGNSIRKVRKISTIPLDNCN